MKATGITNQRDIGKFLKKVKGVIPISIFTLTSSKYAEDACKRLKLDEETMEFCKATADNISSLEILTGKKPSTIAGVAIMMIVQRTPLYSCKISFYEVSIILGMGESAIKSAYREVEDLERDILPVEFLQRKNKKY